MKVTVTDGMGSEEEKEIGLDKISGKDLLKYLGISTFVGMIEKNGVIVLESEVLTDKDKIKVLNMIHGG